MSAPPPPIASPLESVSIIPQPEPPQIARPASPSASQAPRWLGPAGAVFGWAALCLVWTFWTPGLVAWHLGVLTAPDVEAEVRGLRGFAACNSPSCPTNEACDRSIPAARYFAAETKAERPRVAFFGFVESRTTYCYFLASLALGLLFRRYSPPPYRRFPRLRDWGSGLCIFCVWGGMSLFRAAVRADAARTIYSFVHWDVSKVECVLQAFRSFLLCVFVASIWRNAQVRGRSWARRTEALRKAEPGFDPEWLNRCADSLGECVQGWYVDSLLLGLAFLPWTVYYWSLDRRWGDPRYFMSTLVWHIVWGLCWWVVSRPTLSAWHQFSRHRARVRAHLMAYAKADSIAILETSLQWLDGLKPVSTARLVITGAASIVTFLLPALKAFH